MSSSKRQKSDLSDPKYFFPENYVSPSTGMPKGSIRQGSELIIPEVKKNHAPDYEFPWGGHIDPNIAKQIKAGLLWD